MIQVKNVQQLNFRFVFLSFNGCVKINVFFDLSVTNYFSLLSKRSIPNEFNIENKRVFFFSP